MGQFCSYNLWMQLRIHSFESLWHALFVWRKGAMVSIKTRVRTPPSIIYLSQISFHLLTCLSFYLSFLPFIHLSLYLSVHLSVFLFALKLYLSPNLSFFPSIQLSFIFLLYLPFSFYLSSVSFSLSLCLFACLSFHLFHPSIFWSSFQFIHLQWPFLNKLYGFCRKIDPKSVVNDLFI